jgi:hypothetical protein
MNVKGVNPAASITHSWAYVRVPICQLREKLEDALANPTYLLTDSYIEYRFREP